MQLTINTSLQQTQLAYSHISFRQSADYGAPSSTSEPQDVVELSSEARLPVQEESPAVPESDADPAVQVEDPQSAPAAAPVAEEAPATFAVQQGSLALSGGTLSIDGTISTAGGAEGSFSLDLQVLHAFAGSSAFSVNSGANGYGLSFARSAFELSSTSFSFSLSSEVPDGTAAAGSFVKDELKEIRHTVQPLIKDFLRDACNPFDKPNVNKLFRAIG